MLCVKLADAGRIIDLYSSVNKEGDIQGVVRPPYRKWMRMIALKTASLHDFRPR